MAGRPITFEAVETVEAATIAIIKARPLIRPAAWVDPVSGAPPCFNTVDCEFMS